MRKRFFAAALVAATAAATVQAQAPNRGTYRIPTVPLEGVAVMTVSDAPPAVTSAPMPMPAAPALVTSTGTGCSAPGCSAPACDAPSCAAPSCDTGGCQPACEPGPRVWADAAYLYWWVKPSNLREPLASTGPAAGLGLLDQPGTAVVLSDSFDYRNLSGVRVRSGAWLNADQTIGTEGSGFYIFSRTTTRTATSAGLPVLARPYFDATINAENVRLLGLPGAFAGGLQVSSETQFWGSDSNLIASMYQCNGVSLQFGAGFRYMNLSESLIIRDAADTLANGTTAFNGVGLVAPSTTYITDAFRTSNDFYGGQITGKFGYDAGAFGMELTGKVGFGTVHQVISVDGFSSVAAPGVGPAIATVQGGLLATTSNIGRYTQNNFAVLPEGNVQVHYNLMKNAKVFAGYSFLYLSNVVRPGDQLNGVVNPTLVPVSPTFGVPFGPQQPALVPVKSDFWAHGVNVGLSLNF